MPKRVGPARHVWHIPEALGANARLQKYATGLSFDRARHAGHCRADGKVSLRNPHHRSHLQVGVSPSGKTSLNVKPVFDRR
jgi:hypothetical protein